MKKPIDDVVEGLERVFGPNFGMSPHFRQPKSFQMYFEDGYPRAVEQIRHVVKEYFSAAELGTHYVGTELLRFNVVMQDGARYIVTAHRLSVGGTEVWNFTVYDDAPPSDFLAGLLALPKTVGAWRPYLLKCIPGAEEPEHSRPGTVRFRVNMELDTDLSVWVHFDEKSVSATLDADWLASQKSGSWVQVVHLIDDLLETSRLFPKV